MVCLRTVHPSTHGPDPEVPDQGDPPCTKLHTTHPGPKLLGGGQG